MKIAEYIEQYCEGSPIKFARMVSPDGVSKQTVNFWINKGYIIINGVIYSPRERPPESILFEEQVFVPQRKIKQP